MLLVIKSLHYAATYLIRYQCTYVCRYCARRFRLKTKTPLHSSFKARGKPASKVLEGQHANQTPVPNVVRKPHPRRTYSVYYLSYIHTYSVLRIKLRI